jgi:NADPH2:quinone reductase
MVSVVRIAHTGAPEVMNIEQVTAREPGPGEVWLEQEAIGVNFLDVSQRNGAVPLSLPSGLGLEGAGWVAAFTPATLMAFKTWLEARFAEGPPWLHAV